jgi:hypothetical protein
MELLEFCVLVAASSVSIRNEGVKVSSNWPDFTAQTNAAKNVTPSVRLMKISKKMTSIGYEEPGFATAGRGSRCMPARLPAQLVIPQAKSTTEMELNGMSTAQMSGERMPALAMLTPMRLYIAEIPKLARTIRVELRAKLRTWDS